MPVKELPLSSLRREGTQCRVGINAHKVEEYADLMREEVTFPELIVFHDGTDYWLADGHHRADAYAAVGMEFVACDVREGSQRDAILFALGVNATHGLARTNADKRRAVEICLDDAEWSQRSTEWIRDTCAVSWELVNAIRKQRGEKPASVTGKDGKRQSSNKQVREREPDPDAIEQAEPEPEKPSSPSDRLEGKPSKAAKPSHFDDAEFGRQAGAMIRLFTTRAERVGTCRKKHHMACKKAMDEVILRYQAWQAEEPV